MCECGRMHSSRTPNPDFRNDLAGIELLTETEARLSDAGDSTPIRAGRTVVPVDLENALTLEPSRAQVIDLQARLDALRGPEVLIEIAQSHYFAKRYLFEFPYGRHQLRSGRDGADTALLDVVALEGIAERFDNVVLHSGDHAFAAAIAELARRGVHTKVVALRGSLSNELRLAAHDHELVERLDDVDEEGGFGVAA